MSGLDFSIVKKKPVLVGGVAIAAVLVVFLVMRGGGGGTAVATSGGVSDAQASAAAQVQIAALQAQAQGASYAFQLEGLTRQQSGEFAIAGLSAQLQTALANMSAGVQTHQLDNDLRLGEINIAAQRDMTLAGFQNQQALAMTQSQMQLGLAGIQAQTAMFTVGTSADLQKTLAQLQSQTTLGLANLQAGTARQQSNNNLIGSIITGGLALFSDSRLKENIQDEGHDANGFHLYSWNYLGSSERHVGVMASEVRHTGALSNWNGFSVVDYERLAA